MAQIYPLAYYKQQVEQVERAISKEKLKRREIAERKALGGKVSDDGGAHLDRLQFKLIKEQRRADSREHLHDGTLYNERVVSVTAIASPAAVKIPVFCVQTSHHADFPSVYTTDLWISRCRVNFCQLEHVAREVCHVGVLGITPSYREAAISRARIYDELAKHASSDEERDYLLAVADWLRSGVSRKAEIPSGLRVISISSEYLAKWEVALVRDEYLRDPNTSARRAWDLLINSYPSFFSELHNNKRSSSSSSGEAKRRA